MTDPEQLPDEPEIAEPAIIEQAPVSPERKKGFFGAIRDLGALAMDRVVEITPGLISKAGEMVDSARGEIASRAPEVLGRVEKVAGLVADKAAEGYGAVSDATQEAWRRRDEVIVPATEFATKAYDEVIRPIGGDVLTAVGQEYGVEIKNGKLDIGIIKLGRKAIEAARNPAGALTRLARIARKTAKRSSVKMFVS